MFESGAQLELMNNWTQTKNCTIGHPGVSLLECVVQYCVCGMEEATINSRVHNMNLLCVQAREGMKVNQLQLRVQT